MKGKNEIIAFLCVIGYAAFLSFYIYNIDKKLKAQEESLRISDIHIGELNAIIKSVE